MLLLAKKFLSQNTRINRKAFYDGLNRKKLLKANNPDSN